MTFDVSAVVRVDIDKEVLIDIGGGIGASEDPLIDDDLRISARPASSAGGGTSQDPRVEETVLAGGHKSSSLAVLSGAATKSPVFSCSSSESSPSQLIGNSPSSKSSSRASTAKSHSLSSSESS